ncbi:fructose-specific PTS transporter subunit EIIC [Corynebacterium tapiri]|uniref:PTS mannose transporter subunit IIABC n=1 Tax=Corynebacterium tapiri TaxID=1448266 RepID=A0A5C4U2B9_9CORY|nr:fructose-specific PTS transporter subunit EIIC [Corynebacterium tapiri]TNL96598.1 PTS mannose transporter subunit IIABC [Corynebacterium tapiri]
MSDQPLILAITACPTGIAHTYMAAENLEAAAADAGVRVRIETHGSIGVEGTFSPAEIEKADAVLIAADTEVSRARFAGKRLLSTGVDKAISHPKELLTQAQKAPVYAGSGERAEAEPSQSEGLSRMLYKALMNGVSHMVPFVVTGGLLLAVALSLGGEPGPEGLVIPDDSFWKGISEIGALAFTLMVPVLSAYIAVGIADRPALAPGFITGLIATTGSLYGSEAGAGFIGGIVTGFLSGFVALAIRKIKVHKYIAPIWPIIVIPILTTLIVGLAFIYLLGAPISAAFDAMTHFLAGLEGGSVVILGLVLGAMLAFDMGGPLNKTAFLFSGGMLAAGNAAPLGMFAVAVAVPPLGLGLATLFRRAWFGKAERDAGIAALFMGCFGITEGAIPLAAAKPLQLIPANVVGGAVGAAVAGLFGVENNVMHGGPIVALLGAVSGVGYYFLALAIGTAITCGLALLLLGLHRRGTAEEQVAETQERSPQVVTPQAMAARLKSAGMNQEDILYLLAEKMQSSGYVSDVDAVVKAAQEREKKSTTAVGHGVAIPHARSAGVEHAVVAVATCTDNIAWPEDVDIVFFIAVPEDAGKQHLRLLSSLARAIMREDFRAQLRLADSPEELAELVRSVVGERAEVAA